MIAGLFAGPAVLLDLETTGASPTRDRITEIGLIELDAQCVHIDCTTGAITPARVNDDTAAPMLGASWSSLVQPGIPIPEFITGLTGIEETMVCDAPTFADLAPALARRLEGRLLIAHNVRFDYGFLRAEFMRAGIAFAAPVLCSARLSRKLYPQHHRHNLDALMARHGIFCLDRHRALPDAQVIGEFLRAAVADLGAARVAEVAHTLITPASAPREVLDLIDELPGRAGCFILRAADGSTLYVGSGSNVREAASRVLQRSNALGRALIAEAATIDQERHVGPLGAALAQRRLIDRLAPRHQRARDLDHALERESWRLVWHAHARPEFALQECQQSPARAAADPTCVDPAAQQECATHFGDFPSERIARAALNAFAREHRLCPRLLGLEDAAGASVDRSGTRALVDSLETPGLTSTDAPASGALGESCAPGPLRAASASHTCAGLRAGECFGACTHPHPGSETPASHRGRALTALARLPRAFPAVRPGLAGYRESDDEQSEVHVFDGARYLGAARDADALAHLLARRQATLAAADRDPVDRVAVDPQPLQILTRVLKAAGSRIDRVVL